MLRRSLSSVALRRGPPLLPIGTTRVVPSTPSWDPRSAFGGDAPVVVSDADMARYERLSLLSFPRETLSDEAEFSSVRAGVSAVLTAARALDETNCASGGGGGVGSSGSGGARALDVALAALSEDELEEISEARWSDLRDDAVTEGTEVEGKPSITLHASRADAPYFIAPNGNSANQ